MPLFLRSYFCFCLTAKSGGLSGGEIAGIVIGSVVAALIVVVTIVVVLRKRKQGFSAISGKSGFASSYKNKAMEVEMADKS